MLAEVGEAAWAALTTHYPVVDTPGVDRSLVTLWCSATWRQGPVLQNSGRSSRGLAWLGAGSQMTVVASGLHLPAHVGDPGGESSVGDMGHEWEGGQWLVLGFETRASVGGSLYGLGLIKSQAVMGTLATFPLRTVPLRDL